MTDILYHYCTSQTFTSIVNYESLWLSSMSLSSDSMEGRHVIETFMAMARQAAFPPRAIQDIYDYLSFLNQKSDGLAFCLSEAGDLLSQWRGYAADGTGISIGFSRDYLKWLGAHCSDGEAFAIVRVVYDPITQQESLKPIISEVSNLINEGAYSQSTLLTRGLLGNPEPEEDKRKEKATEKARQALLSIFSKLYAHKSEAFREEREWRVLNYLVNGEKCLFRAGPDRLIRYRNLKLLELQRGPIKEVILGPKHLTPPGLVEELLHSHGFGKVPVRRSVLTYR